MGNPIVLGSKKFTPGQPGVVVIDDVGVDHSHYDSISRTFAVEGRIIGATLGVIAMMIRIQECCGIRAFILFPGNGGYLMERLIEANWTTWYTTRKLGIDVSRESDVPFEIPSDVEELVVFEDLVGTGGTLRKILPRVRAQGYTGRLVAATLVWHDQAGERHDAAQAIFDQYDLVIVGQRVESDNGDIQHVRSLSTLARKANRPENLAYSVGRETAFRMVMGEVRRENPWIDRIGVDLGYRLDPPTP
jgi:hypothetical protein